jgi:hypothetical protein
MALEPSWNVLTLNTIRQRETQPGGAKGVNKQCVINAKRIMWQMRNFRAKAGKGEGNNRAKMINSMAEDDK